MGLPKCSVCNIELKDYRSALCKTHSKTGKNNPMAGKKGELHPRYKGGYVHSTLGYKFVMHNGKKVYEHRLIKERLLGRKLLRSEIVHHINGVKTDNRPENLEVMTQSKHVILHKPRLKR